MNLRVGICVVLLAGSMCAFAQTTAGQDPLNVSPAEAGQHLIKRVPPLYPSLAETARLQGIVALEVTIDETGATSVKVISGHPMLIASTIDAVKQWKYQPFEKDGKLITVKTNVVLQIPETIKKSEIKQEDQFLSTYWPAKNNGESALKKHDYDAAVKSLLIAHGAAEQRGDLKWLELARMDSQLANAENGRENFANAENWSKSALELYEKHKSKDEPEAASTMEILARVYMSESKAADAEPLLIQAIKTYKYHIHDSWPPDAVATYGSHIAAASFSLVTVADTLQQPKLAKEHCKDVLENAKWLAKEKTEYVTAKCNVIVAKP